MNFLKLKNINQTFEANAKFFYVPEIKKDQMLKDQTILTVDTFQVLTNRQGSALR